MYLHTRLEGNKSNACLETSFSYGLTLTLHLLDGHFEIEYVPSMLETSTHSQLFLNDIVQVMHEL